MTAPAYRAQVFADTPIGYWRLGDLSGTEATDETGVHHGTYQNTPTLGVAGLLTQDPDAAASFDPASSEYVSIPDHADFDIGSAAAISLEAWVSPDSVTGDQAILCKGSTAGGWEYALRRTGAAYEAIQWQTGGAVHSQAVGGVAAIGTRAHVASTFDGTTLRLYVDGVEVASDNTLVGALTSGTADVNIARRPEADQHFDGTIDEVAIYRSALSAARVLAHYRAGIRLVATFDSLIVKRQTKTATFDSKIVRTRSATFDSLIVDPRGSFRGTMSQADYDALSPKQPSDKTHITDSEDARFWTGAASISGQEVATEEAGVTRKIVAAVESGWRLDWADPTYPLRYWDGTTFKFRLDNAGTVEAVNFIARPASAGDVAAVEVRNTFDETTILLVGNNGKIKTIGTGGGLFVHIGAETTPRIQLTYDGLPSLRFSDGVVSGKSGSLQLAQVEGTAWDLLMSSTGTFLALAGLGIRLTEITAPPTPPANSLKFYAKDRSGASALFLKSDSGTEYDLIHDLTPTTITFGGDVQLSRGAADRLDLGSGDSLRFGIGTAVGQLDNGGWIELAERVTPAAAALDKFRLYGKLVGGIAYPHVIEEGAVESRLAGVDYAQSWTATQTFTALQEFERAAANNDAIRTRVTGDASPRLAIQAEGEHELGSGAAAADMFWGRGGINIMEIGKSATGNAIRMWEMTAPAAPAANAGVLFFRDDGAGKTQLCARFNTGAIQVIASQP